MSENRVIGNESGMPWSIEEEYSQYLSFVKGNTVIMGRRSFEIFGRDLGDSWNIVVTRQDMHFDNAVTAGSLEDAITIASKTNNDIFIAGGASVYSQAIPLAGYMYLSTIKGTFEGNAFFPEYNRDDWTIIQETDRPDFCFHILKRR